MRTSQFLLLLSLACAGAALAANGPNLSLPLAVSLLSALGALLLVVTEGLRPARRQRSRATTFAPTLAAGRTPRRFRPKGPHVVIDGSNVMHWNGETPHLDTLREVVATLRAQGYQPGIIFDANAGYKFGDRYLDDRHFAKLLKLPADRVLVVPKGEPADPTILAAARELGAKVITNDRYREWAGDYPEVASSGHLVKGGHRDGQLWLEERALTAAV